jgi:serine/threonine protein kinase
MTPFTPIKFGKYLLLDKIATGGMAELFLAKQTGAEGFEKFIAIKKILHHLNTEDKLVDSFIEEAKLAAHLQHPNIVQIYDFGAMNDTYFMAMEYLFGKDLRFTIKRSLERSMPISLGHALFIVTQLLTGLEYAHTCHNYFGEPVRLIHRDIGPQNIIITYDGQVKIIDFGIAKAANQNTTTQVGTIKGKVSYMSPEQAGGEVIDHRSDIFSAGIVMYELVTGRKMYEGDTFQVLAKARERMFQPAEDVKPGLPDVIYRILGKALEKDPASRYQTAEDMCRDIESFMLDKAIRVSQRDLSVYMKTLFQGESDESDFRKTLTGELVKKDGDEENTLITEENEATVADKPGNLRPVSTRRLSLFVMAFAVVLSFYVFSRTDMGKVWIDRVMEPLIAAGITSDIRRDHTGIQAGRTAVDQGRYAEAITLFEDILATDAGALNLVAEPYSRALTARGEDLFDTEPQKARAYLEVSYGLNPGNGKTCFLLGKSHTLRNENRKALEYYEKAAAADPLNPDIFFNMGYNYAVLDDYGKAKDMYTRVIDLAPPFVDQAYFNLGLIQEKTGRRNEAVENMRKALSINPDNRNAARFLDNLKLPRNK